MDGIFYYSHDIHSRFVLHMSISKKMPYSLFLSEKPLSHKIIDYARKRNIDFYQTASLRNWIERFHPAAKALRHMRRQHRIIHSIADWLRASGQEEQSISQMEMEMLVAATRPIFATIGTSTREHPSAPDWIQWEYPLESLTKEDCQRVLQEAGIEEPERWEAGKNV